MILPRAGIILAVLFLFYKTAGAEHSIFGLAAQDEALSRFEFNLLGFHPSFIMQRLMEIWLNELSYFGYMLGITLPVIAIFLLKKLGRRQQLESYLTSLTIACCISFAIISLFPVSGPREGLAGIFYLDFYGGKITQMAPIIINMVSIEGGSFPAVYFGLVTISALYLWDHGKIYIFLSFALMTAVFWGGVYLRYHYLMDGVIALLIAFFSIILEGKIRHSGG